MTHRFLIEPLGGEHDFVMVLYRNIQNIILKSDKRAVLLMFHLIHRNVNSTTRKNTRFIKDLISTDILSININQLKHKVKFSPCPNNEQCK